MKFADDDPYVDMPLWNEADLVPVGECVVCGIECDAKDNICDNCWEAGGLDE